MFLTILLSRGHKLRTVIGRTWVQRSVWHLCHLPPKQKPLKAVPQRLHHFQFRHHNNIIRTNSHSLSFTLSFKNPVEFPQSFVMKTERMLYAPVQIHKYDPGVKNEVEYLTNSYHDYTSEYATSLVRSTSEMLFEQFCESRDDIEWVYKNGDTGQQYFSIVYREGLQNQWLFYADYIIMKKNGTVWVIETKGKDKNIDIQIENKFNAFKNYATEHSLHWGFIRDKGNPLYINNTEFAHDMADNHWVPLSQEF